MKTTLELKEEPFCCSKKMNKTTSSFNGEDTISWVCVNCGYFITLKEGLLDEEELEDLINQ